MDGADLGVRHLFGDVRFVPLTGTSSLGQPMSAIGNLVVHGAPRWGKEWAILHQISKQKLYNLLILLEAITGIEPVYTDLQS